MRVCFGEFIETVENTLQQQGHVESLLAKLSHKLHNDSINPVKIESGVMLVSKRIRDRLPAAALCLATQWISVLSLPGCPASGLLTMVSAPWGSEVHFLRYFLIITGLCV